MKILLRDTKSGLVNKYEKEIKDLKEGYQTEISDLKVKILNSKIKI